MVCPAISLLEKQSSLWWEHDPRLLYYRLDLVNHALGLFESLAECDQSPTKLNERGPGLIARQIFQHYEKTDVGGFKHVAWYPFIPVT